MSRKASSVSNNVINLADDDDDDGDKKPSHHECQNSSRFRGGRQNQITSTFSNADVIDLVNDGEADTAKRRQAPTQASTFSGAKRRRSSYDEPTQAKDHATITDGIVELLEQVRNRDTVTCAGRVGCVAASCVGQNQFPWYNHQPLHYKQNDNWSCGYRNLQMMISSMLPTTASIWPNGVPSIHEIQSTLESAWKVGVDVESAVHHSFKLAGKTGKRAFIGTIEAWAYLSYLGVDAVVIQFLNSNRTMIGDFIWNYYAKLSGPDACSCFDDVTIVQPGVQPIASPSISSFEYGCRLFNTRPIKSGSSLLRSACTCAMPTLYLQWEGHSITVAGIRRIKRSDGSPPMFNLIVLDPHENGAITKKHLKNGIGIESNLESVVNGMRANKIKFELPVDELVNKRDSIQVLMSTAAILSETERKRRTKCQPGVNCITASTTYPLSRQYSHRHTHSMQI